MTLSHNPSISAVPAPHAWARTRASVAVWLFALLIVVVVGNAHGGYYPTAWGWCVLAFAWVAGIVFLVGRRALSRLELVFVAGLSLFVGWNALSIAWTQDVDSSVLEVQRGLLYVFAVLALLLVARRGATGPLLGGLVAGATWLSLQALGDRMFPDAGPSVEILLQARLQGALGYATGFGLLGAMAALPALGMAVHGRSIAARAAAGAALPVLLTATYFTFSRGAVLAIAAGLLGALVYDRRRLTLLTAGALVAATVRGGGLARLALSGADERTRVADAHHRRGPRARARARGAGGRVGRHRRRRRARR